MAANENIFLGSGSSTTMVPEVELFIPLTGTSSGTTELTINSAYLAHYYLVPNLYVGCTLSVYSSAGVKQSGHIITANSSSKFTIGQNAVVASNDYVIIDAYGAPCPGEYGSAGTTIISRLNADNFLGLMESATFPQVEQEMKQLNLALGGTRNITHQYRGIRTASGGSLNFIMHTGAMLYYALGKCTSIACTIDSSAHPTAAGTTPNTAYVGATDAIYLDTGTESSNGAVTIDSSDSGFPNTGPLFIRTSNSATKLLPPLNPRIQPGVADFDKVTRSTIGADGLIDNAITYTFDEQNTSDLPSFAIEQCIAKDPNSLITDYAVATTGNADNESTNFVRIARGNRINNLTLTASEGEEMKMTAELNTRAVESVRNLFPDTETSPKVNRYEGRHSVETNSDLFNWSGNGGTTMFAPFFFSSGTFSILGAEFLKMESMTLTINNNFVDKRYMGGHRDMKEALAAQRMYELQFTAVVTDDALFQEIFNEAENDAGTEAGSITVANGLIELKFTKDNEEEVLLQFKDYFIDTANWTIPDDKGPVTVEVTCKPRNLQKCEVKTSYILQG